MKPSTLSKSPELAPETLRNAAEWFVRVRTATVDSGEHAEWLAWIEADPSHRAAFAEIQEAWDIAGVLESPPWPHPEELASKRSQYFQKLNTRPVWALAASLLLAIGVFFFARHDSIQFVDGKNPREHVATGRGEQQSTMLPDGSRIELGGQTGIAVTYTPQSRLIVADEGEAFYKVAHDPTRPFIVQAGPVSVTAIGTAFSVRREGDAVSVVVTEGVVEVNENAAWPGISSTKKTEHAAVPMVRAKAGQRVRFNKGELSSVAEPVKTELATAWRRGRLRFEDESLRVVVASLNRYSAKEIVIDDPSLEELKFTGTVFDDRVEDWLDGVQVVFPVKLKEIGDQRVAIERNR